MGRSPASIVMECLTCSSLTIKGLKGGDEVLKLGKGFGSLNDDSEIKADRLIGDAIMGLLSSDGDVQRITIEGMSDYSQCKNAFFADIVACGVIDHRSGDLWIAYFDDNGVLKAIVNGFNAYTDQRFILDLGSMIVFGEMYYPENRALLMKIFANSKGWLRNPGSAAYEMAMVSSGSAVAFICDRQKQHELGAGYLLVNAAGGVAIDHNGKDLGEYEYVFNTQTSVILAANRSIADELLRRIL